MKREKKINPDAQAPKLIEKVKKLGWTQTKLGQLLKMTQQTLSNYSTGCIERENYNVIKTLEDILVTKLRPPAARDLDSLARGVIQYEQEKLRRHGHPGTEEANSAGTGHNPKKSSNANPPSKNKSNQK